MPPRPLLHFTAIFAVFLHGQLSRSLCRRPGSMYVDLCGDVPETREPNDLVLLTDTMVMLWHTVYGVFLQVVAVFASHNTTQSWMCSWEFFTTLEYEWRVIRGHIPYRWTIWVRDSRISLPTLR